MSKEGSYEYEMEKIARMVLTICHVHKDKFFGLNTLTMSKHVIRQAQSFYNFTLTDYHILDLSTFLPDVFEITNHGDKILGLSINVENADLLEIW